jgi:hypothetical protein
LPSLYIKSAASAALVSAIQDIENQADECHKNLDIFQLPENLANWAVLTRAIEWIEREIKHRDYGSRAHVAILANLSIASSQVMAWIRQHGNKTFVPRTALRWNSRTLGPITDQALTIAMNYGAFTSNFPLWHKNLLQAELTSPSSVRFMGVANGNESRVRAYQQGLRPPASRPAPGSSLRFEGASEEEVKQKILHLVNNGSSVDGPLSFSYGKPWRLWGTLYETQLKAMNALFRRDESLDLGGYAIGEFKRFYAGLLAICSVHENASDLRGQRQGAYPLDSVVLVRGKKQWISLLNKITSLEQDKIDRMIQDLTFGVTGVQDLYVHPFIPLTKASEELGVVPHFPLNSRADENVINVCSRLRPEIHDAVSNAKENEMRDELRSNARPGFSLRGPRLLPSPLPDIDLIVEEASSSCVLIVELKWLRKTMRATEHSGRQEEFLGGLKQLDRIKGFLQENPRFLLERGDISQDLREVQNLHYLLVARDYFVWVDPVKAYPVFDYEPFSAAMSKSEPLSQQVRGLLRFEWLPLEGRDFSISYERRTLGSVAVESQIFHANY